MFLAIVNDYLHIAHRVTRECTAFHCRFDSFFNWRQIRLGEIHTHKFIVKFKIALMIWLNTEMNFAELACSTRLFFMAILCVGFACDPFSIWDLRLMSCQSHLEFCLCTMNGNINMLIAHALQNSLVGDLIVLPGESHVLLTQAGEGG